MSLDDKLLKPEEIKIIKKEDEFSIKIPISPIIIEKSSLVKLDDKLASSVFYKAALQWQPELYEYYRKMKDDEWRNIYSKFCLSKPGYYINKDGVKIITGSNYTDRVVLDKRTNLVRIFVLTNDVAAIISENEPERATMIIKNYLEPSFNQKRLESFGKFQKVYTSSSGDYSAILFLKHWIVLYLNEALKSMNPV